MGDFKGFAVVLRGYDMSEVDELLRRVQTALSSTDQALRASLRHELHHPALPVRLRGYHRLEVDEYLRRAIDWLA
jgi:DivIVA domain-containing protein